MLTMLSRLMAEKVMLTNPSKAEAGETGGLEIDGELIESNWNQVVDK